MKGSEMSEWQKIDSAPKDGTRIIVFLPGFGEDEYDIDGWDEWTGTAYYSYGDWRPEADFSSFYPGELTHWMPLPNPPSDE